jgi:hypothetical protein
MQRLWKSLAAESRLAQLGKLLVAALLLFHGWLLARRLFAGELFDYEVLWRWLGAAALLVFWRLQRHAARGLSARQQRRSSLAFWSLVLVLHIGVPASPAAGPAIAALPLTELGNLAVPLLAAVLLLHAGSLLAGRRSPLRFSAVRRDRARLGLRSGFLPQVSCRPPPARL